MSNSEDGNGRSGTHPGSQTGNVVPITKAFQARTRASASAINPKNNLEADPVVPMPWTPAEEENLNVLYMQGLEMGFFEHADHDTQNYEYSFKALFDGLDKIQTVAVLSTKEQGNECFYHAFFPKIEGVTDKAKRWRTDDFNKLLNKVRMELNDRFGLDFDIGKAEVCRFPVQPGTGLEDPNP